MAKKEDLKSKKVTEEKADKYAKPSKESTEQEIAVRQELQQSLEALNIKQDLYADLPSDTAAFFLDGVDKIKSDREALSKHLQISTKDIIAQQRLNINITSDLRYSQLTFSPLKTFPDVTINNILGGGSPQVGSYYNTVNTIPWAYAPIVEIFAHTPNAPEFALVDELVSVEDATGDNLGFEETQGVYTTVTSTFNYDYNSPGTKVYAKLDRRIFDANCYSHERKYRLLYASGHVQEILVMPPSPCWQASTGGADDTYTDTGWIQRYCTGSDYISRRWGRKNWATGSPSRADLLSMSREWGSSAIGLAAPGRFDWASTSYNPQLLIAPDKTFVAWSADTAPNGSYPTKGDSADTVATLLGQTISNTLTAGSTEYGAPIGGVTSSQVSRTDMLIFPTKAQLNGNSYQSIIGTYSWVDEGLALINSLESHSSALVYDSNSNLISPPEGAYGVVRNYTYAENLPDCNAPAAVDIEVCIDGSSPSFYQTTNEDCNGTDITAYLNGSSGAYNLIDGGCCEVDCSDFNMFVSSTDSTYGGNNGTITIDFTNQTAITVGNYNGTANQHAYDVQLTSSTGSSIIQNSNAAYASGAFIQDSTCDTTSGSSIVSCNSNSSITVGMSVTGTGIAAGSFVGAITQGQPGAVTKFQLSSAAGSNSPVNASSPQTNTTLTFAIAPFTFIWGSLPPTSPNYYTVTVTDEDGCTFESIQVIAEEAPNDGCTDNTAINYDATANLSCVNNCCLFCGATDGFFVDSVGNFIDDLITSSTVTPTHATSSVATDGAINLTGTLNANASGFITATMSYKYTLHALTSSGDISSAGAALATTTSTNAQGIVALFGSLGYGYYGIKIEIEDSSTGADAGLEICYHWVSTDVKADVCTDQSALNFNITVPVDLQISQNGLCTYPVGCNCGITSITQIASGCSFNLYAAIDCNPVSAVLWDWTYNGVSILSGQQASVNSTVISLPSQYVITSGNYELTITDNGGAGNCITTSSVNVNLPICGCTDSLALNYDATATVDDGSCIYCVDGCMDPTADNFNPLATCDDGSCTYPIGGCTDPTANNYNAAATIDDGSCEWTGCLDQTALNYLYDCTGTYNPNINIADINCCTFCSPPTFNPVVITTASASSVTCVHNNDGSASITNTNSISVCAFWDWSVYDVSGTLVYSTPTLSVPYLGTASTGNILAVGPYTWVATDCNGCTEAGSFAVGSAPLNCGCTDPNADNFDPNATIDDGSCLYLGCTDPNAANYNPNAIQDDGTCTYILARNPCSLSPQSRRKIDSKMFGCLTLKGAMYLNKLRIGYADDCSIMNQWKLILVNYLLQQKDLDCMFNCSDDMTTAPAAITCSDLWVTGGPVTGVNDQAFAGSSITTGGGTLVGNPAAFFVLGNTLFLGDVIKMPSGLIWKIVVGSAANGGHNPETAQGQQSGHWQQCTSLGAFPNTYTTNYIDPFIRFMNEQCDKCTEDADCIQGRFKETTPY